MKGIFLAALMAASWNPSTVLESCCSGIYSGSPGCGSRRKILILENVRGRIRARGSLCMPLALLHQILQAQPLAQPCKRGTSNHNTSQQMRSSLLLSISLSKLFTIFPFHRHIKYARTQRLISSNSGSNRLVNLQRRLLNSADNCKDNLLERWDTISNHDHHQPIASRTLSAFSTKSAAAVTSGTASMTSKTK